MTDKDFDLFPSPCYIMEEELLRKNLTLIKSVADRAGVEIILAFKSLPCGARFPYSVSMWSILRQAPYTRHAWRWRNSAARRIHTLRHIRKPTFRKSCDAAVTSHSIRWLSSGDFIP